MKKYKQLLDKILLFGLWTMSILAIAPDIFIMPNSFQMLMVAGITVLLSLFLLLFWREQPSDEREIQNQALASRAAYIVGSAVLIVALVIQSLHHSLDAVVPIVLFAMIFTKIFVQKNRDNR